MSENPELPVFETHRPWEDQPTFNEILAEWIQKAPYLLASLVVHAILGALISGYIFLTAKEVTEAPVIEMQAEAPIEEIEEEEPEPEEEIIEEPIEEPVLQEAELEEAVEEETLEETGDPDFMSDAPFDSEAWNNDVGLGGGAGGKYGRRGGRGGGRRGKGSPTEKAVQDALKWLADHQTPDEGFWDCDDFWLYDPLPDQPQCDGEGNAVNDVGVTGLALLAFLGNGNTMSSGPYQEHVRKGINWLRDVQLDNGLFGDEVGNPTLYNHSIATMAMGEAFYFANSLLLRRNMQKAVEVIVRARNPYGAWRYKLEPDGSSDSSITGWMVFALKTAEDGGIPVSKDNYEGAEQWFAQMTDPATGRTGYAFGDGGGPGSRPSRRLGYADRYPPEKSEALTAVALLSRIFMTDTSKIRSWKDHPQYEELKKQADLCVKTLPEWDAEGGACDMYYWYYGTFALYQWGDPHWSKWKKAIEAALLPSQRQDGNFKGSWDPVGPWGEDGGRVYSTAICAIILEVYYRYNRLLGAR